MARIFAERQARARRQMKWTLVLSACFFAALAVFMGHERHLAAAAALGLLSVMAASTLGVTRFQIDPMTTPFLLGAGSLLVSTLAISALGGIFLLTTLAESRFSIFHLLNAIMIVTVGVLGSACGILMLFFGRRTVRLEQPAFAITRAAIGPFPWRDVVKVKAIGTETAPRLFVMLKDAQRSGIKTSPFRWPYRWLFKHDPLTARIYDIELRGVGSVYPSRIGLLDALHRAMPPRVELET